MHDRMRMCKQFWLESLKRRDNSEHQVLKVRIMPNRFSKEIVSGGVDWINLAQDMVHGGLFET
jgi:hypothetical protein